MTTFDPNAWRKSSYSDRPQSECVEVAPDRGAVGVRDSKLPEDRPIIAVPRTAWAAFVRSVR